MEKKQSRRNFLKTAAVAGAAATIGGAVAGCSPAASGTALPKWDKETEVLVVGFGLAGLSAAIAAHDAGAKVLVIEKMDEAHEGGNSKVSGNIVLIPANADDGKAYFKGMAEGHLNDIPEEMIQVWVDELIANKQWVKDLTGKDLVAEPGSMSPELPFLPGAKSISIYGIDGKSFNGTLFLPMRDAFTEKKIEILHETPAKKLITNADGAVVGVTATSAGKDINIKASKAVIMTTGGFEFNPVMKANYLHAPIYGAGNPGNTGDGHRMVMELGADLWHMNDSQGPIWVGYLNKEVDAEFPDNARMVNITAGDYIFVDTDGKRFMDETKGAAHGRGWDEFNFYDGNQGKYPRNPCWLIFDDAACASGPLTRNSEPSKFGWASWYSKYTWSSDNSAEVEKGWIVKADSVEALAKKINLDPDTLKATVDHYNEMATAGTDADFGRTKLLSPLSGAVYAMPLVPLMVNTQGGPKRNEKAQILRVDGSPIKHLYSAGEFGSIYSWQYNGGGNLGECMAFGRIAGKNAAAETAL